MKQIKNLWKKIPRPYRSLCNLMVALVAVLVLYVSIGSPAFSREHLFRRTERSNFVGPSTILFHEKVENYDYSYIIVGETERGVVTFALGGETSENFNYFKKTGDIMVISAPTSRHLPDFVGDGNEAIQLPVFVIDKYPDAVYAQLEVSVDGVFNCGYQEADIPLDQTFYAESTREYEGCFCFSFDLPHLDDLAEKGIDFTCHGTEGHALDALALTFTHPDRNNHTGTITATIRLYDEDGTLLIEQEQELKRDDYYWEP